MNFIQTRPGQYVTHCAVDRCNNPVALGLQVEIVAHDRAGLQPRNSNSDNTYTTALFTPCADHINDTINYLVNLRFNPARIKEIPLTQLQEWAGVRNIEGQISKRREPTKDGVATPDELQRLKERFSKR